MSELYYGDNSKNSQNAYLISQIVLDRLANQLNVALDVEIIDGKKQNIVVKKDVKETIIFASDSPLAIYHFLNGMLSAKKVK